MKSLKQMRYDLVNLRLDAVNSSLWNTAMVISERANRAINDAVQTYEFTVQQIYNSLLLTQQQQVIALPFDIQRIVRIEPVDATGGGMRHEITQWRHVPTPQTNLLYVEGRPGPWPQGGPTMRADIVYETQGNRQELPKDLASNTIMTTASIAVGVTGGTPSATWTSPGFFEISSPVSTTDVREVVRYQLALPTGFTGLQRDIEGHLFAWPAGSQISAVLLAPENMMPVIQAKAQAQMYRFWIQRRAIYDQYTAIASEQQLDVEQLMTMARAFDDDADRGYRRVKKPPAPTTARSRTGRH